MNSIKAILIIIVFSVTSIARSQDSSRETSAMICYALFYVNQLAAKEKKAADDFQSLSNSFKKLLIDSGLPQSQMNSMFKDSLEAFLLTEKVSGGETILKQIGNGCIGFAEQLGFLKNLPQSQPPNSTSIQSSSERMKTDLALKELFKNSSIKPDFKNIESTEPVLIKNGWMKTKCKDKDEIGISCFTKNNHVIEIEWAPAGQMGGTIGEIKIYPSQSQSQPPQPQPQPQRQQPSNTTQTLNYSHGRYLGEVMNGKAHGYGTYTSAKSGTVYTGQFIADTFSGDGTMTWTNGSKFVGKWQNDVGVSGTMTYANGNTTRGTVRTGVFTPSAAQSNSQQSNIVWNHNNSKMKIDMVDNTINIYYVQPRQAMLDAGAKPNTLLVNGTIKGTQITGTARIFAGRCGQFTYPVTGNISNNGRDILLNGQAPVVNLSNCQVTRYVPDPLSFNVIQTNTQSNSQPSQSQANPDVRINYTNGDTYFGQVKDGKPNGQGTFTTLNGYRYVGEFKDGLRNGQGKDSLSNGNRYDGEWKDGDRHGQGTFTRKDGFSFVGQYKDGMRNGQGTDTFSNGDRYVGEFKDGKRNGQGTFTTKDGTKQVGLFKDDIFVESQKNTQSTSIPSQPKVDTDIENYKIRIMSIRREIETLQSEALILDLNNMPTDPTKNLDLDKINDLRKLSEVLSEMNSTRDSLKGLLDKAYSLAPSLKTQ